MQVAFEILHQLSDGKFHSGTHLAQQLKISRASIWKAIHYLKSHHLSIQAVSGRGYRWYSPFELLDKNRISAGLEPMAAALFPRLDLVKVISSTNDYLLSRLAHDIPKGTVCIAEAQTQGKGRMGRKWISPFGSNIYLSFYWHFVSKVNDLSGLSLLIGLAVLEALKTLHPLPAELGIKWPNDIWYKNAKLCGILIESVMNAHDQMGTDVVVGIGLNNHMQHQSNLENKYIDLTSVFGFTPSRNQVINLLLNQLSQFIPHFEQQGFADFLPLWKQYDLLQGRKIQLTSSAGVKKGIAQSINERGELCVQTQESLIAVRYGEISVTPE